MATKYLLMFVALLVVTFIALLMLFTKQQQLETKVENMVNGKIEDVEEQEDEKVRKKTKKDLT